jgi:hypothetical protein
LSKLLSQDSYLGFDGRQKKIPKGGKSFAGFLLDDEKEKKQNLWYYNSSLSTLTLGSSTLPCTLLERSSHESEKREERKREKRPLSVTS